METKDRLEQPRQTPTEVSKRFLEKQKGGLIFLTGLASSVAAVLLTGEAIKEGRGADAISMGMFAASLLIPMATGYLLAKEDRKTER